jgi:hypothetical protein
MTDFNSVLDDLYSGSARVLVEDVQPPAPKKDTVRTFVLVGVVALVAFCALFVLAQKTTKAAVLHDEDIEVPDVIVPKPVESPKKKSVQIAEETVFRITGKIPTSEDDASETKVSADKADALIEKYLHR